MASAFIIPRAEVITPERAYIAPHEALCGCISHYTVYAPQGRPPEALTIVPDASGSLVCRLGQSVPHVETWFWGPSSRAVQVENTPEKYPLYIMVEFLPCGANRLLGIPMSELHNAIIPLCMLNAPLHKALVEAMETLAANVCTVAAVCASLDAVLLRLLACREDSSLARYVASEMRRTNGTLRTAALARQLGRSSRHIERVMAEHLGMPAKSLARIIRINAACRCLDSPSVSLTELAHSLHYHDQSHFIHDFVGICGVTPGAYRARRSHFYNEELKFGPMIPEK